MITNYHKFMSALSLCNSMAREYLHRCIIDGKVDPDNMYYFSNLFSLHVDPDTGRPRIICSNTDPKDKNENITSYNLRFLEIDEELFNVSSEDFDKMHMDSALVTMVKMLDSDIKLELYDELRNVLQAEGKLADMGGL